ncbi:MAG: hypothetical protein OSJ34_07305 [Muribaculaceae bacterium]|jgi:hypothetical protein|nr:hypothetical protein [Muribaculaceae bacterium]
MSNAKERIRQYIDYLGISTAEFERTAQIGNGLISKPATQMRSSTLRLISDAYPDLNMDWIRKGRGEMIKAQPTNCIIHNIKGNQNLVQQGKSPTIIKDVKIAIDEDIDDNDMRICSLEDAKKRIKDLKQALKSAEIKIIKLEGKLEQQNETIKLLAGK